MQPDGSYTAALHRYDPAKRRITEARLGKKVRPLFGLLSTGLPLEGLVFLTVGDFDGDGAREALFTTQKSELKSLPIAWPK